MRKLYLLLAVCSLVAAEPVCSDLEAKRPPCPQPARFLVGLVDSINAHRHLPLSGVIAGLALPKGTVVGAQFSGSLQRSDHLDNPRLYLLTECGPLTLNLYSRTLELAVVKQVAEGPIAGDGPYSKSTGEVLIDFDQFPREKPYTAAEIVNHLDPRFAEAPTGSGGGDERVRRTSQGKLVSHDTHACSGCHVDAGGTGTSLGQIGWNFSDERIEAMVSPYERRPGEKIPQDEMYCVKTDLQALYDCKCGSEPASPTRADCRPFLEQGRLPKRTAAKEAEACARLRAVLDLAPTPHCDFHPGEAGCLVKRPPAGHVPALRPLRY